LLCWSTARVSVTSTGSRFELVKSEQQLLLPRTDFTTVFIESLCPIPKSRPDITSILPQASPPPHSNPLRSIATNNPQIELPAVVLLIQQQI
ncbi:hypothetical protein COCSADRAFT_198709, partial [Bipolaris sorokiniana ND90Pr]